ncbi:hypothetical protein BDN67DRAFT_423343 [Paxillus ammoniavirescens]|nr:hypothetical protein BDN67DRAFT_423343 [Paxillus ammoniavirescens]
MGRLKITVITCICSYLTVNLHASKSSHHHQYQAAGRQADAQNSSLSSTALSATRTPPPSICIDALYWPKMLDRRTTLTH